MSTLAYIIARDLININKSEYSPKKHIYLKKQVDL
jgi:hypothetical protein